ncbi:unnamed protein product [Didymodactylos carnosus]|uniref:Uncharacterized protein n=1 Tax=Didymodactylos carnosus TaxID=1234261 RepID=A0A814HN67_9BILA|nr:unnamed protein product [Didymodactylos carnosus]CAF3784471.1 unnamed protein product [Didymodactylos carnosus]
MNGGLSPTLSNCNLTYPLIGKWFQPGINELIYINETYVTSKGTCIEQDAINKFIFYNDQARCKRCILFIQRHINALQFRESECYEFDDPVDRICNSLTPDTPLYTIFRENFQAIECPIHELWKLKRVNENSLECTPKSFHNCLPSNSFRLTYNKCSIDKDVTAKCMAIWSDGPNNYVVARSSNRKKFICFSYTKAKHDDNHPLELYLPSDDSCRDLLSRESATVFTLDSSSLATSDINLSLPQWTLGKWSVVGGSSKHFYLNRTQIILYSNGKSTQVFKLTKLLRNKKHDDYLNNQTTIRIKAKALEHCISITYCITLIFRSHLVIDLSLVTGEQGCQENKSRHQLQKSDTSYTLFKQPNSNFDTSTDQTMCPQSGIFKSISNYRPVIQISACTGGSVWTLLNGCEKPNELTFTTTCSHEIVPDVQVITAIKGTCLATWSDKKFQRTLVIYEHSRSFCLIHPTKIMKASWILYGQSCNDVHSIYNNGVENGLHYTGQCTTTNNQQQQQVPLIRLSSRTDNRSSSNTIRNKRSNFDTK